MEKILASTILQTRVELESREKLFLRPEAVRAAESRGRRYPAAEHPWRTCFQRDRDRIIHSAAFRRLEAKTQVFIGRLSDYSRTRLTHTIEVAQIARTLARAFAVNEDLAEAAALAHDLGHPPYGHCGEAALDELMAGHGGFEHNRHSLRVVDYLEHPYPDFRGLNLTFETRQCMAKHESRYDHSQASDEFGPGWAPLEGQIADLADAIAYNSHDLDDALAAGLIQEEQLTEVPLYVLVRQAVTDKFPKASAIAGRLRAAKSLIDLLLQDILAETAGRLEKLGESSPEVSKLPEKMVSLSPGMLEKLGELEKFLLEKVYRHPLLLQGQAQGQAEIRRLFQKYLQNPELLPGRYRERLNEQGRHQVICDYIAGMTDHFCHEQFQILHKP